MDKISIVIPCFNEENNIPLIYSAINKVFENGISAEYELIFVDDGSKDNTLKVLRDLSATDQKVKYISFSRNFGKEAALYAGIKNATGDFVAVMDADMQDPPELLCDMYKEIKTGEFDCIAARRVDREGEPKIRSFFARAFYKLINKVAEVQLVDGARDFRLMNKKYVDALLELSEYNRFSKGLFDWVGFKTKWIEYKNVERRSGKTKWSFWKLFKYSVYGIVAFSSLPLYICSLLGITMCAVSFLAILFIIFRQLFFGGSVAGWPSLVCIIVLIGGLLMLGIGILGFYLSKIYLEVKNRPIYISREEKL